MKRYKIEVDYFAKIKDKRVYYVDAENQGEARKYLEDNIESLIYKEAESEAPLKDVLIIKKATEIADFSEE